LTEIWMFFFRVLNASHLNGQRIKNPDTPQTWLPGIATSAHAPMGQMGANLV
jgi:hypothetical protein